MELVLVQARFQTRDPFMKSYNPGHHYYVTYTNHSSMKGPIPSILVLFLTSIKSLWSFELSFIMEPKGWHVVLGIY